MCGWACGSVEVEVDILLLSYFLTSNFQEYKIPPNWGIYMNMFHVYDHELNKSSVKDYEKDIEINKHGKSVQMCNMNMF